MIVPGLGGASSLGWVEVRTRGQSASRISSGRPHFGPAGAAATVGGGASRESSDPEGVGGAELAAWAGGALAAKGGSGA